MLHYQSLNDLFDPVNDELEVVIEELYQNLKSDNILINKMISYVISSGGKRIRPALSLLSSKLFMNKLRAANLTIAQIAEIIHAATLLHDDVIDSSTVRRGQRTVNDLWGNKVSVIAGDYLLSKASVMLSSLNNTYIVEIFARVLEEICLGEIQQSALLYDSSISWDEYILKSKRKTAILFASAMQGAAIVSDARQADIELAMNYGLNLGLAFQIVDDILNFYTEQQVGKPSCQDLRAGIITAPVIFAMKEEPSLKDLISTRFTDDKDFNKAVELIKSSTGIQRSKELACEYINQAVRSIDNFESSVVKTSLIQLAHYVVERKF